MNIIPWRVRVRISDNFPLFYHLAASLFRKHNSESYWDERLAEGWSRDERRWPTKIEIISKNTNIDAAILDIACGNGSMLKGLRANGFKNLSGLEISRYAVSRLSEEGFSMIHGKLPHIPAANKSFDTVIASQVLEHIIRRDTFAKEINRVLRSGGDAYIFVPNDCLGPIDEPEHVIKYNRATFESFLKRHFDIVSIDVLKDIRYSMSLLLARVRNPTL